jgi:DUF1680 family protein
MGDETAKNVLLKLAAWADARTQKLSYADMQTVLKREFGGVGALMVDLYYQTGDKRWIEVAARFDHAQVFDPLAQNQDKLLDLHANTQIPKWIAAIREYKATGKTRYRDIAANAWNITVSAHTYSIGGNSQGEAFRAPNLSTTYFDYYERTLLNHLLGQQNPKDPHGHITYYTDLRPGGRRGHGPGGIMNYTDDYNTFWCCQGTGTETNTKLTDSIYWQDEKHATLFVNLFTPSVLKWTQRNAIITFECASFGQREGCRRGEIWNVRCCLESLEEWRRGQNTAAHAAVDNAGKRSTRHGDTVLRTYSFVR